MAPLNPKATSFHPPPVVLPRPAKRLPPQAQVGEIPMNRSPIPPPPPGSPPPPPPPPPAGPPRPASRQRSSIPQMGQVPEGRVPRPLPSLRPLLPPRFEARRRIELQQRPGFEEALNWYRDHLTEADYNFNNPTGLTDIQKLLRGDANPAPGVDSHSWRPVRDLGAGTYGSVVLWQRDTGNCDHPLEYVACKDAKFDVFYQDYCHEGHLIRRLNVAGCPNVVKIHEWSPLPEKDIIRMILEYCPMGDFRGLYKFYYRHKLIFPEAFLWHVFHSIATAICYCARGTTEDEPVRGWQEIIHRDLKPTNILLSEPTNPQFYPTLKVTDFGLSYSVPTNTDSVRRFKRNYWSGGTEFYCAPEVDVDVRSDPDQAPDDIVSPRSDIFSLGCILMKFLWLAQDHYHTEEWHQLDLDQTWAYEWFPYSRVLVDLVRQCLEKDARARPRPLELFKITREHAARTKSEVQYYFDRDRIRNGGIYYGMLLSRDQQTLFMENPTFAQRVLRETDWFYNNHTKMQLLLNTRQNPLASAPPPGCIALLSGLQGHIPLANLARIYHGVPQGNYLEKMPVYDAQGREVVGPGGHPFLRYVGQERLRVPELNKNWRAERARGEAYRLERERVWEEQLARARQDAMRHPPGLAADVRNLGEMRPRLLDGGYGNIDPNLGYGRPPLLPLRPPPPPPPPHDNAGGRAGLFGQVGRGGFEGMKRAAPAPAPAPAAIGDFLGGVKGGRVAKRGGGEGRGGGGYKM